MALVLIWPCHNRLPSRLSFSSKAISWPLTLLWYISHVIITFWPPWTDWDQSSEAFLAIHKIHTYQSYRLQESNTSNRLCHWFSWFYHLWEMLCVSVIINDHVVDKQLCDDITQELMVSLPLMRSSSGTEKKCIIVLGTLMIKWSLIYK